MKRKIMAGILAVLLVGTGCARGSGASEESAGVFADDSIIESVTGSTVSEDDNQDLEADIVPVSEPIPDESLPGDSTLSDEAVHQRDEYVIYCPDMTLPDIFETCYPGYETVLEPYRKDEIMNAEGKIGDMKIRWIIADYLEQTEYIEKLDELLINQRTEGVSDYDWVDLFVLHEMNLEKYIGDGIGVALDLHLDLGITPVQTHNQTAYTRKLASRGIHLLGASIDTSPGVFMYRRSIAREVLGSDDPETVSEAVSDWDRFQETARKAGNTGYKMLAGYEDAFDVYSQMSTQGWYSEEGSIRIDDNLISWAENTRKMVEEGICGDMEMWSAEWIESITGKGDVFGYFLSAEEIHTLRRSIGEYNTDSYGDWGIVKGPGAWYRGGTWLCAAAGSPNRRFSAEIISNLTCNEDIMKRIYDEEGMTVNNRKVLLADQSNMNLTDSRADESIPDVPYEKTDESIADMPYEKTDGNTVSANHDTFFGGQLTGPVFYEAAKRIEHPMADGDKWALDDIFADSYHPYIRGECSLNDSLASFYQSTKSMIFTEDEEW